MKSGHKEFTGTLKGFDVYVNCVLEDAIEYDRDAETGKETQKKLESILLNGNNVCMIVPGGERECNRERERVSELAICIK